MVAAFFYCLWSFMTQVSLFRSTQKSFGNCVGYFSTVIMNNLNDNAVNTRAVYTLNLLRYNGFEKKNEEFFFLGILNQAHSNDTICHKYKIYLRKKMCLYFINPKRKKKMDQENPQFPFGYFIASFKPINRRYKSACLFWKFKFNAFIKYQFDWDKFSGFNSVGWHAIIKSRIYYTSKGKKMTDLFVSYRLLEF